jgi:hypothetical protein
MKYVGAMAISCLVGDLVYDDYSDDDGCVDFESFDGVNGLEHSFDDFKGVDGFDDCLMV